MSTTPDQETGFSRVEMIIRSLICLIFFCACVAVVVMGPKAPENHTELMIAAGLLACSILAFVRFGCGRSKAP